VQLCLPHMLERTHIIPFPCDNYVSRCAYRRTQNLLATTSVDLIFRVRWPAHLFDTKSYVNFKVYLVNIIYYQLFI
jgi:hypothetical protein